jgi:DNA-binding transcriptional regulator YhcF (GntR family)
LIFLDNSRGGAGLKLYEEVASKIEKRIAEGVYCYGDRLPSVRESSIALSVSMTTAYHAYNILESRGLIRAKPQSGYFVARPESASERGEMEHNPKAPNSTWSKPLCRSCEQGGMRQRRISARRIRTYNSSRKRACCRLCERFRARFRAIIR